MSLKSCWICKHLEFNSGEEDWSEVTPGCAPTVSCPVTDKGHWYRNGFFDFYEHDAKAKAIEIAESCEHFEEGAE